MKTGLIVLGVLIAAFGLLNHFVIKANPIAHTSTIALAVGAVLAVIGIGMMVMGGRAAS